ncbi:MAG: glycosyltransferase [Opitutae bacterium]|jgi:GT2 family glycosyltransferase/predicted SAM-dependent methyltransferase|nr:glycosyltransferase [Opitutae bacterium]
MKKSLIVNNRNIVLQIPNFIVNKKIEINGYINIYDGVGVNDIYIVLGRRHIYTKIKYIDKSKYKFSFSFKTGIGFKLCKLVFINNENVEINIRRLFLSIPDTIVKISKSTLPPPNKRKYHDWIANIEYAPSRKESSTILSKISKQPLISVIIPIYNPNISHLKECLNSVLGQFYENWEVCAVDDGSTSIDVINTLNEYSNADNRIKVLRHDINRHISCASNSALGIATGEYALFLDQDDLLRQHSLMFIVYAINLFQDSVIIYSDEDKIDKNGKRYDPFFKPAWDPILIHAQNYICHLMTIKMSAIKESGMMSVGYEGSQDWDLVLRISNMYPIETIIHIPFILYHWRAGDMSTATNINNKSYSTTNSLKAINDHIARNNYKANARILDSKYILFNFELQHSPHVSIIIPSKDNGKILRNCVDSIIENTSYTNYTIYIIDNNSKCHTTLSILNQYKNNELIRVQVDKQSFNYSAINNQAVKLIKNTEVLVFLNDDTQIISKDWLESISAYAVLKDIGAVGVKLLYPDNTLQHAGVVLGMGGVAGHAFKHLPSDCSKHMHRANLSHSISAVTGACLAIEAKKFNACGGFDEKSLKVAFNDIDLCIKLLNIGLNNVYIANVRIMHHESFSRGSDKLGENLHRFRKECEIMKERWSMHLENDKFYNPNLELSTEQFDIGWKKLNLTSIEKRNTNNYLRYFDGTYPSFIRKRICLYSLLRGNGLEIGAFEHPAIIPDYCKVKYCDVLHKNDAIKLFPEINEANLPEIDYIINLDETGLNDFSSNSYDFIIINHVIEHLYNPIKALSECFRVLKKGGLIVISVPDKEYTFDRDRPLTEYNEIVERWKSRNYEATLIDYMDIINYIHKDYIHKSESEIHDLLQSFKNRREHLNIWNSKSYSQFMESSLKLLSINALPIKEYYASDNNFEYSSLWIKN